MKLDITKALTDARDQFIADDKAEPFADREYAEKTIEYFDALIPLEEGHGDFPEIDKRAMYDIVSDIKRLLEKYPEKYIKRDPDGNKQDP